MQTKTKLHNKTFLDTLHDGYNQNSLITDIKIDMWTMEQMRNPKKQSMHVSLIYRNICRLGKCNVFSQIDTLNFNYCLIWWIIFFWWEIMSEIIK